MKKIMFNDAYGLTQATIEGGKTNTRRVEFNEAEQTQLTQYVASGYRPFIKNDTVKVCDSDGALLFSKPTRYKVGEVVAVAQRYADIPNAANMADTSGWRNKMFVKAELMPHRIRITGIRAERLQGISDEDCIKEGIYRIPPEMVQVRPFYFSNNECHYDTPRDAFSVLINKVSGRGTWASNPWVVAYEYELVK